VYAFAPGISRHLPTLITKAVKQRVLKVADFDKEKVPAAERISNLFIKATILAEDKLQSTVNVEAVAVCE
jgi:hypothetical protein